MSKTVFLTTIDVYRSDINSVIEVYFWEYIYIFGRYIHSFLPKTNITQFMLGNTLINLSMKK